MLRSKCWLSVLIRGWSCPNWTCLELRALKTLTLWHSSKLRSKSKTCKQLTMLHHALHESQDPCACSHNKVQFKPSEVTQSHLFKACDKQPWVTHSDSCAFLFLTQTHRSASYPASLLPRLAESLGWCAMPTEGHDAHRPSPQRWVSLSGERVRAARASHWESALELKEWKVSFLF